MKLSKTQEKVLRVLCRKNIAIQVAGHGNAPYVSACRALVRRDLAFAASRTGWYGATDAGRAWVADNSTKV